MYPVPVLILHPREIRVSYEYVRPGTNYVRVPGITVRLYQIMLVCRNGYWYSYIRIGGADCYCGAAVIASYVRILWFNR